MPVATDVPDQPAGRLGDTLTHVVIGLGRLVERELDAALSDEGVTMRHLGALGHLQRHPRLSVSDLARRAGVTAQSMHATIQQLVERKAIDPGAEAGRGRTKVMTVTDEGRRLLQVGAAAGQEIDATILAGLPEGTREALRRAVQDALVTRRTAARSG